MDEQINTFDERSALSAWLYRLVVHTALMRLRTKARMPAELPDTAGPPFTADGQHAREVAAWALPPEQSLPRQEALAALQEGIGRLPERSRVVYVLAEVEGLPHQEIATILGITVEIVKTSLHRARLVLREGLTHYVEERRRTLA